MLRNMRITSLDRSFIQQGDAQIAVCKFKLKHNQTHTPKVQYIQKSAVLVRANHI